MGSHRVASSRVGTATFLIPKRPARSEFGWATVNSTHLQYPICMLFQGWTNARFFWRRSYPLNSGREHLLRPSEHHQGEDENHICVASRIIPFYSLLFALKSTPGTRKPAKIFLLSIALWQFALVYLDYIMIFSKNKEASAKLMRQFMTVLHDVDVNLRFNMLEFFFSRSPEQILLPYQHDKKI